MSEKGTAKPVTTEAVVLDEKANEELRKSQTNYKGNSHFDLVEVEFVKDGSFYKKGQKDKVHPSVAEIFKKKGLIETYKSTKK